MSRIWLFKASVGFARSSDWLSIWLTGLLSDSIVLVLESDSFPLV